MPPQPLVHLARDRRRYEQLVAARFSTLSIQDAEDVVSDALIAVADRIPENAGPAWFGRVVLNRAEDFRRARDGRPRTGPGRRQVPLEAAFDRPAPAPEDPHDRELAQRTVHRALKRLPAEHRFLLARRHLAGAPRGEIATTLGLTISQYETRHTAAWSALRHVVAADEPTPRCRPVRRGHVTPAHAEAHLVECLNCRLGAA
jgi:RNA polymerase sigma factor (sigma-70 family)